MTVRDPACVGPRFAAEIRMRDEIVRFTEDDSDVECLAIQAAGDVGAIEAHLADLDFLLTGTACYALTRLERLDRVRALLSRVRELDAIARQGGSR